MGGWTEHAACRGKSAIFFPEPAEEDLAFAQWELASAIAAKKVCAECPVFSNCAAMALDTEIIPAATQGVMAGMTRWEREWIRDDPARAKALSAELVEAGVDPIALSLSQARESFIPMDLADTPPASARRYGVPLWVAQEWHKQPRRRATPWGDAVRATVAQEPDRWFSAVELVDRCAALIPQDRLAATRTKRSQHTACSDRGAASALICTAIFACLRHGFFERRKEGGRLYVRASPRLLERHQHTADTQAPQAAAAAAA